MKITKTLLLASLTAPLLFSQAHAALITHAGYTYDDTTNIVVGGGLEWLRWDVTFGHSIDSAISAYSGDGWGIASNADMAGLFNAYDFGGVFDDDENTAQSYGTDWTAGDDDPHDYFIDMFGISDTWSTGGYVIRHSATAIFGHDLDNDGYYNGASVLADGIPEFQARADASMVLDAFYESTTSGPGLGIALVRNIPTHDVPEPGTLTLLGLGLAGLGLRRSRKSVG